jgi:hypothetical protein
MGLGRSQEHGQGRTGDQCSNPRRRGDVLMDPEPAQDEREDQFRDEKGLDNRELPVVECDRLEDESSSGRHPAEEPERLTDQEGDNIPSALIL